MFRYVNMPKLVAFYLREFSVRSDGTPSDLYKFIFCLCLPFISKTFRRARMVSLAIAECTNSQKQILRVLEKISGVTAYIVPLTVEYMTVYKPVNAGTDPPAFAYNGEQDIPKVPYALEPNAGTLYVRLNGASQSEVEGYLALLIPFYIRIKIIFEP